MAGRSDSGNISRINTPFTSADSVWDGSTPLSEYFIMCKQKAKRTRARTIVRETGRLIDAVGRLKAGHSWKVSALLSAGFAPNDCLYNNEKSVTYVLNLKCYPCLECSRAFTIHYFLLTIIILLNLAFTKFS